MPAAGIGQGARRREGDPQRLKRPPGAVLFHLAGFTGGGIRVRVLLPFVRIAKAFP
jgi:hypothetical protein